MKSCLIIGYFHTCTTGFLFRKLSTVPMHSRLVFTFTSFGWAYMVLCWSRWSTWTCVLCRVTDTGSICILLHANLKLDQHHLLKMLLFSPHCVFLASLSKVRYPLISICQGLWFDSIEKRVCFYASIMWFLLLQLFSTAWNQGWLYLWMFFYCTGFYFFNPGFLFLLFSHMKLIVVL